MSAAAAMASSNVQGGGSMLVAPTIGTIGDSTTDRERLPEQRERLQPRNRQLERLYKYSSRPPTRSANHTPTLRQLRP
ncbi:hypothetical protein [Burkholderia cepacia]|uniref:hypothetical protein n=1 Tax=Burkholderia cepacia TaxID=292 RepID=UPI001295E707|nr:hypothetical protein [Burkholderia cepacia]